MSRRKTDFDLGLSEHIRDMEIRTSHTSTDVDGSDVVVEITHRFVMFRTFHVAIIAAMIGSAMVGGAFVIGWAIGIL